MNMSTSKKIEVPFIEGLEAMDLEKLDLTMEAGASKFSVCENNWPQDFPYTPDCNGSIARSRTHLAVMYHVRGLDLRATALEDNGNSWEDSCCEFFISDPEDGTYYNFELTCIGSLLSSKRKSRTDSKMFEKEVTAKVIRYTTLEKKIYEIKDELKEWTVVMMIPFEMIGIDPDNIPSCVRGNFYKCGDLTAHPHFLSWNPVVTPKPDFHRPEFFGEIIFK